MLSCLDFYKDVGYVCGDVRFSVKYAGNWPFLAVAVNDSFHVYSADQLKLTYASPTHSSKILLIDSSPGFVFTATKDKLRSTNITTNEFTEIDLPKTLTSLVCVGSQLICSYGSVFFGYEIHDLSQSFEMIEVGCNITAVAHPDGFAGKILVALDDGSIQLWNVRTQMQIYGFSGFDSVVTRMVQSPFMNVMAFVTQDGRVVMHNFKTDNELFSLQHPSPINDLSFRLDGPPQLAVGLESGALFVWDLNLRQIIATVPNCHNSAITSVCFLKSQNIVITGGIDNAIRQWEFDQESKDLIRILRSRVGHQDPPVAVGFVDVNGINQLVTASGKATIISMNPASEMTSTILSTNPLGKNHLVHKVQSMSSTDAQRFCSLATQHKNGTLVFLWDIENSRFARRAMTAMPKNGPRLENDQAISFADFNGDRKATCSCLTKCGNFGCVGTDAGTVEIFVTQSARHKGSIEKAHDTPVVFVHVDALNLRIISGASDGSIFFHSFESLQFDGAIDIPAPVKKMVPHPNSQLLAISSGEKIVVIDCQSRNIAREFNIKGEYFCFSHDGKYFFIATEKEIYLYDLITITLIEKASVPVPITGIAADPNGELIATLHKGIVAVKLWYFRPGKIASAHSFERVEQTKQEGLAIFTEQPQLKIKNLLNPPKDPLKFAKSKIVVPFFLQQTANVGNVIDEASALKQLHEEMAPATEFVQLMLKNNEEGNFDESIQALIEMNFDKINFEISSLRVEDDGIDERLIFVNMLIYALEKRTEFDIIQAIIHVFLNEYGVKILENPTLKASIQKLKEAQEEAIKFLDSDLSHSKYLVQLINRIF